MGVYVVGGRDTGVTQESRKSLWLYTHFHGHGCVCVAQAGRSQMRNTRLFYELVKGFSDQVRVDRLTIGLGEYESGGVPQVTSDGLIR